MKTKVDRRSFIGAASAVAASPLIIGTRSDAAIGPARAKVTVHPDVLHPLPKTQYGHFIEHLGKCIKGGIWAPGEEPDMFLGGVRKGLLAAVKSINPSLIRYPGGCFADGYHWKDGIGPSGQRPRRKNEAWAKLGPTIGPEEDNQFGTDEFLAFSAEVGAQPMITVNVGSGTEEEAADWVEYCNGSRETKWGAERAKNGRAEPWNVKYWFVGNEIYGSWEIGYLSPPEYVKVFKKYAAAMRAVDPSIKLIAVGDLFDDEKKGHDVDRTILSGAGEDIDYLSVHQYVPALGDLTKLYYRLFQLHNKNLTSVYYDTIGSLATMEKTLLRRIGDVRAFSPKNKFVPLAFDEWNLWFRAEDIDEANYCLRDGVWTARMLNLFHRHAPSVPITNIAQMVNCLGIIGSGPQGTFLTPSALVYKLYTQMAGEELLQSEVECEKIPHDSKLPMLDISATRAGERLTLLVANLHRNFIADLEIQTPGMELGEAVTVSTIYHPNVVQYNTFAEPEAVRIETRQEVFPPANRGGRPALILPQHSVTAIEFTVKES